MNWIRRLLCCRSLEHHLFFKFISVSKIVLTVGAVSFVTWSSEGTTLISSWLKFNWLVWNVASKWQDHVFIIWEIALMVLSSIFVSSKRVSADCSKSSFETYISWEFVVWAWSSRPSGPKTYKTKDLRCFLVMNLYRPSVFPEDKSWHP